MIRKSERGNCEIKKKKKKEGVRKLCQDFSAAVCL